MKTLIGKSGIFISITAVLILLLNPYLADRSLGIIATVNSFKAAEKNSVEVLLLGSSHMNKGVDPILFESEIYLKTEAVIGSDIGIDQVYWNLKNALKEQNPKLVIIDTWPISMPSDFANDLSVGTPKLTLHLGDQATIYGRSIMYKGFAMEQRSKSFYKSLNILRNHDIWTKQGEHIFDVMHTLDYKEFFNGLQKNETTLSPGQISGFKAHHFGSEGIRISEDEKRYIEKIIALSKEADFQLLFFNIPIYDVYYQKVKRGFERYNRQLNALIGSHPAIKYFDLNDQVGGLSWEYIVKEKNLTFNQHLNYKGILMTTYALSEFIKDEYPDLNNSKWRLHLTDIIRTLANIKSNGQFYGSIESVNEKNYEASERKNELEFFTDEEITIKGWMAHGEKSNTMMPSCLVLKNESDEVFIAEIQTELTDNSEQITRMKKSIVKSSYRVSIPGNTLSEGMYKIYQVLRSEGPKFDIQDPWKWILIE